MTLLDSITNLLGGFAANYAASVNQQNQLMQWQMAQSAAYSPFGTAASPFASPFSTGINPAWFSSPSQLAGLTQSGAWPFNWMTTPTGGTQAAPNSLLGNGTANAAVLNQLISNPNYGYQVVSETPRAYADGSTQIVLQNNVDLIMAQVTPNGILRSYSHGAPQTTTASAFSPFQLNQAYWPFQLNQASYLPFQTSSYLPYQTSSYLPFQSSSYLPYQTTAYSPSIYQNQYYQNPWYNLWRV